MTRNFSHRLDALTGDECRYVLKSLVLYLEALERLYSESLTLPESTKVTSSLTLQEIDYLMGIYHVRSK